MSDICNSVLPDSLNDGKIITIPTGTKVFEPGDPCKQFVYLLRGTIRVDLVSRYGRPVTLYRFGAGQTCVLTTSCLFSGDMLNGEAIVEEEVTACVLPVSRFYEKLSSSSEFQKLVFKSFSERLASMMERIEEVTSAPIEMRLASGLLEKMDENSVVKTTHDELAKDIGTAREVISRKLSTWAKDNIIARKRGQIVVIDVSALKNFIHFSD